MFLTTVIPALPGYRIKRNGLREDIIAWGFTDKGFGPVAITLLGAISEEEVHTCEITDPAGLVWAR